jgi:hypothetical protein
MLYREIIRHNPENWIPVFGIDYAAKEHAFFQASRRFAVPAAVFFRQPFALIFLGAGASRLWR